MGERVESMILEGVGEVWRVDVQESEDANVNGLQTGKQEIFFYKQEATGVAAGRPGA